MTAFLGFLNVLAIPLLALNLLGGAVSGVWLLLIGEWRMVLLGVAILSVSGFVLGAAVLLPPLLIAVTLASVRKRPVQIFVAALGSLYAGAVILLWCVGVLWLFGRQASTRSVVPVLIWSYGVAVGPWANMASHDQDAQGGSPHTGKVSET
jgi:hypothetical protein